MTTMEGSHGMLADRLFEQGAIKLEDPGYKLKLHEKHPEAPLSPIFLNLRTPDNPKPGPLDDETFDLVGEVLADVVMANVDFETTDVKYIGGIPNAGDPFAKALQAALVRRGVELTLVHLAKQENPDGTRRILGVIDAEHYEPGEIILVDDLVTQADTKLEATEAVENQNFRVVLVVVLVDRMQGGKELIEQAGYRLVAAFPLQPLLDHYVALGFISQSKADQVMAYIADNRVNA